MYMNQDAGGVIIFVPCQLASHFLTIDFVLEIGGLRHIIEGDSNEKFGSISTNNALW